MRKLKTEYGILYYKKAHKSEPFKYVLYDSDKNFLTNVYRKEYLKDFTKVGMPTYVFFDQFGDCNYYSTSLEDILTNLNDDIENDNNLFNEKKDLFTMDDLINNEYLNHIGEYYVFYS